MEPGRGLRRCHVEVRDCADKLHMLTRNHTAVVNDEHCRELH